MKSIGLPSSEWEDRRSLYEDLEALLDPGFLSAPLQIQGKDIRLRTMYPGDLKLLSERIRVRNSEVEWMAWSLAMSSWMIEGRVFLGEVNTACDLFPFFKGLEKVSLKKCFSQLGGLIQKSNKALKGLKAFLTESYSRSLWKHYGGRINPRFFGVPGVEVLGLNLVQQIWTASNLVEDLRDAEQTAWEHALFVASSQAPKAIKKIKAREKESRESYEKEKQTERDHYYYYRIGILTEEEFETPEKVRDRRVKSVDDLDAEFRRWIKGEKDEHDRVIEDYKNYLIEQYEREQGHRLQSQEELEAEGISLVQQSPVELRAYTEEQLNDVLKNRRSGNYKVVHGGKSLNRVYDRYLKRREAGPVPLFGEEDLKSLIKDQGQFRES